MISLRMMGWGLAAGKKSSAAAVAAAAVTRPLGIWFLENITKYNNLPQFHDFKLFVFQINTLSRVCYQSKCPKSEISKIALRTSR